MYQSLSPSKAALTFGVLFSGVHVLWSVVVLLGWAQAILDFIFWAHMITPPFTVDAFNITTALTLVVVTSVVGGVLGYLLAIVWNRLHRA